MQSSFSSPIAGDPLEAEGIRFTCILELAVGSGHLQLASTDPNEQVALNYNYFQEEFDLSRMREAVRLCVNLLDSEHYRDVADELLDPLPADLERRRGAERLAEAHREHLAAHLRHVQDRHGGRPDGRG